VLKTNASSFIYIEMGTHICIKLKQVALLYFTVHLYTVISPHNHFCD